MNIMLLFCLPRYLFSTVILPESMGVGQPWVALVKLGAIYGQGVGPQGQSYTIPTMQGVSKPLSHTWTNLSTSPKDIPTSSILLHVSGAEL